MRRNYMEINNLSQEREDYCKLLTRKQYFLHMLGGTQRKEQLQMCLIFLSVHLLRTIKVPLRFLDDS